MNEIEQRQIKMFCAIFAFALVIVIVLTALSSFGTASL